MRVHHLHCGTSCPASHRFVPELADQIIIHCLLIESNDGLVLVDTGLGQETMRDPRGRLGALLAGSMGMGPSIGQSAVEQVRALGYDPTDVRHILVTHLDFDHAGGIRDFPQATVHVWQSELEAALSPDTILARLRYQRPTLAGHERWHKHHELAGEAWFGFDYARPLPGSNDEILLIPLPGHTRGHCGVAVRSCDGWLLHAGDAYYGHRELDSPHKSTAFNLIVRPLHTIFEKVLANQQRLATLVREQGQSVRVFCAHDPDELTLLQGPAR